MAKKPDLYVFKLPDGSYLGRRSYSAPLERQTVAWASTFTADQIREQEPVVRLTFPEASPFPAPRYNEESGEYETKTGVTWPPAA